MKKFFLFSLLLCFLLPAAHAEELPLTRGNFLLLLWESQGAIPFDKTAHPFADLPDDAQAQAVAWGFHEGLVRGVGSFQFAPDRPLTRLECAVFLRRLHAHLGLDTFLPDGASLCNDNETITLWSGDDLYWACITGVIPWQEDGTLSPHSPVFPSQALAWLSS